jgi:hypothetical protein
MNQIGEPTVKLTASAALLARLPSTLTACGKQKMARCGIQIV